MGAVSPEKQRWREGCREATGKVDNGPGSNGTEIINHGSIIILIIIKNC